MATAASPVFSESRFAKGRRAVVTVFDAVEAEVAALPEHLRSSPEALLCLTLAERMADTTPRDAATVSKELRAALSALREAVKAAGNRGDRVDELRARRASRKAAPAPRAARDSK